MSLLRFSRFAAAVLAYAVLAVFAVQAGHPVAGLAYMTLLVTHLMEWWSG